METADIQAHECALFSARCRESFRARTCQDHSCCWGAASTGECPTDRGAETLPIDTYSIDISIVLKLPAFHLSNAKSVAHWDLDFCRGPLPLRIGIKVETNVYVSVKLFAHVRHWDSSFMPNSLRNAYGNEGGERICARLSLCSTWPILVSPL